MNGSTAASRGDSIWQGKLTKAQAVGLAASGSVVALSGLALLVFRYLIPVSDAFSAYPHPLWPWLLPLHVFPAPVFFFFVGSIWRQHIVRHWRGQNRRLSGSPVLGSVLVITFSGYLLYFLGDPFWLALWRAAHTVAGVIGIVFYVFHAVLGWRALARLAANSRARRKSKGEHPERSGRSQQITSASARRK